MAVKVQRSLRDRFQKSFLERNTKVIGAIAISILLGLTVLGLLLQGGLLTKRYSVQAIFADAAGIRTGDRVTVAGLSPSSRAMSARDVGPRFPSRASTADRDRSRPVPCFTNGTFSTTTLHRAGRFSGQQSSSSSTPGSMIAAGLHNSAAAKATTAPAYAIFEFRRTYRT